MIQPNWNAISAIGQVLGSLATFAAVIVALRLAREEREIRLRVTASDMIIGGNDKTVPVVMVRVENIGLRVAKVHSIHWTTGYRRGALPLPEIMSLRGAMQIEDWTFQHNAKLPWVIQPGESVATYLPREQFLENWQKTDRADLFRRLPLSKRYRLLNFKVGVGVDTIRQIIAGNVGARLARHLEDNYELNRSK
jgi:hypothetical protein